jgi:hypothetical protein
LVKALDIPKTLLDPELQNRVELPEKSQSPQAVI